MGTRPVEWCTANIDGEDRCFYVSQDVCGARLWEAFQDDREDNGARIFCSVEFPSVNYTEQVAMKKFLYTQYFLTRVSGTVSMTADYKGDAGCWKRIGDVTLCAEQCFTELICNGVNPTIMSQNRVFKTQEGKHACSNDAGWPFSENIGIDFQNRLRWYGKNGIKAYNTYAGQWQEQSTGACEKGDQTCKVLACCDGEIEYISHVNDCLYGYASSGSDCCVI
jgi:hypothetical protein